MKTKKYMTTKPMNKRIPESGEQVTLIDDSVERVIESLLNY